MKRSTLVFVILIGTILAGLVCGVGILVSLSLRDSSSGEAGRFGTGDRVAVIEISGIILDSRPVIEALHRHSENGSVRAIVLRLDTPGGAVAPSQEIYEEVRKVREDRKKPIVASMGSVAASGGYYIASAANEIYANQGSVTGSIGVIMQWTNYSELLKWAKLKPETITSGELKDAGNPTREMTDTERSYFRGIVDSLRDQFVSDVAEGREGKLSEEQVEKLADGRIYTGEEARELKLVDEIGNLQDAIERAAELGKIRGKPTVVYPRARRAGFFDLASEGLFGGKLAAAGLPAAGGGYRFYYLW